MAWIRRIVEHLHILLFLSSSILSSSMFSTMKSKSRWSTAEPEQAWISWEDKTAAGTEEHTGLLSHSLPSLCVPIPENMNLCRGIQYPLMRLPNILDHETMGEATRQASSWIHLLELGCHPDTQVSNNGVGLYIIINVHVYEYTVIAYTQ